MVETSFINGAIEQFTIEGNSKTGKLLVGVSIKEQQGCMYDCDSSEDSDCE